MHNKNLILRNKSECRDPCWMKKASTGLGRAIAISCKKYLRLIEDLSTRSFPAVNIPILLRHLSTRFNCKAHTDGAESPTCAAP